MHSIEILPPFSSHCGSELHDLLPSLVANGTSGFLLQLAKETATYPMPRASFKKQLWRGDEKAFLSLALIAFQN